MSLFQKNSSSSKLFSKAFDAGKKMFNKIREDPKKFLDNAIVKGDKVLHTVRNVTRQIAPIASMLLPGLAPEIAMAQGAIEKGANYGDKLVKAGKKLRDSDIMGVANTAPSPDSVGPSPMGIHT